MRNAWGKIEARIPLLAVVFVTCFPLTSWMIDSIKISKFSLQNPYGIAECNMILLTSVLMIIYSKLKENHSSSQTGDETKIITNRNQSDYSEIWDEVRAYKDVSIEALGHSFNTLWYNFIKKYLYEVIANNTSVETLTIKLVSTVENPASFADIETFYGSLDATVASKIHITLANAPSTTCFFTGLCVNRSALWLSIREPHRVVKANEHVREWRRESGQSSEKMINWYSGIIDHLISKAATPKILQAGNTPPKS